MLRRDYGCRGIRYAQLAPRSTAPTVRLRRKGASLGLTWPRQNGEIDKGRALRLTRSALVSGAQGCRRTADGAWLWSGDRE